MRPRRDAVSRSITTLDDKPEFCWSELTSAISGSVESLSRSFGPHTASESKSGPCSVYWYCALPCRPPTRTSWEFCRNRVAPGTPEVWRRRRAITWSEVDLRTPTGLSCTLIMRRVRAAESAAARARHHGDGFDIRVHRIFSSNHFAFSTSAW